MNIGVFFGSRSPEHDVSIITGELVISELKKLGHNITPVYIGKDGQWYVDEEIGSLKFFKNFANMDYKNFAKIYLDLEQSKGKMVLKKKGFNGKEFVIDLAFPAFHGAFGEDGTIQGLFEIFNLPYVGCDLTSSAITMDKILTKLLYQKHNIPTVDFIYFDLGDWQANKASILERCKKELVWPMFVKPPRLGSSIGIVKVKSEDSLESAIEVALQYGNRVLVENGVNNLKDVTCAVLGNENPKTSLVQESSFSDDLFSYEDKYLTDGGTQLGNATTNLVIPANIPDDVTKTIQDLSIKIYKLFACSGTARIDFLYDAASQQIYANEINTMPGTLYHHLWKASGIEMEELLKELINLAIEKYKNEVKYIHTFQSNLLQQANSIKLQIKEDNN